MQTQISLVNIIRQEISGFRKILDGSYRHKLRSQCSILIYFSDPFFLLLLLFGCSHYFVVSIRFESELITVLTNEVQTCMTFLFLWK